MASPQQLAALAKVYASAKESGCLWPQAQACEVMVETTWGTSQLFVRDLNAFGMQQHKVPVYETVKYPSREFINGKWETKEEDFVKYPTLSACFQDRMATLQRMAVELDKHGQLAYPHYARALAAGTPEVFLTEVSRTWSTGPTRGEQCIAILHSHPEVF